jgi:hypothetical protein
LGEDAYVLIRTPIFSSILTDFGQVRIHSYDF